jgi:hypothetical protein
VTGRPARGYPPSREEMVTEAKTAGAEVLLPVRAGNSVTSCDLGIFMDQAAEAIPALDTHTGHSLGCGHCRHRDT